MPSTTICWPASAWLLSSRCANSPPRLSSTRGSGSARSTAAQVAKALFNKGVAFGALDRNAEAIAAYDDLLARFGTATELPLREQVAKALINKGVMLGALDRSTESAVLWVVVVLALASAAAVYMIDGNSIDPELARGADDGTAGDEAKRLGPLLKSRALLLFTAAITLFHFANAAMLPLLDEKLSQGHQAASSLFMAACIITAPVVMVPMALLVGHKTDAWGRKPLFLAGFAVLPVRGLLYLVTQNAYLLVSIQVLDGIGAGIFGALFFLVVADLTRGTGHYNLALGASGACWGLGAAFSNGVAGLVVDAGVIPPHSSFSPAAPSSPF